jgi:TolA-binding protein
MPFNLRAAAATLVVIAWSLAALAEDQAGSPTLKFNEASGLSRAGRWEAAGKGWREFLAAYPDDSRIPHARLYLAHALYQQKDYAGAAEEAEKVLKEAPKTFPYRPVVLLTAGQARLEQGRAESERGPLEQALTHLRALAKEYDDKPEAVQAGVRIGEALDLLNRPAEAAEEMGRWLARHDKHDMAPAVRYLYGRNLVRAGKYSEGVEALTVYLSGKPVGVQAADARLIRGQGLARLKRFDDALADLDAAVQAGHPRPDRIHYERGWVLQEVKKLAEAAKAFNKVAESADSPLAADALYRAGCLHGELNDQKAAAVSLQAALERKPEPTLEQAVRYRLAWTHMQRKDYQAAVTVCEELNRRFPKGKERDQALHLAAVANERLGNWKAARIAWEELAALKTETRLAALAGAGDAAWNANDVDSAAAHYQAVLEEAPRSDSAARAELGLGRIDLERKKYAEAEAAFRRAMEPRKNTMIEAEAAYWLGEALLRQEKLDDAADQFARAAGGYAAYGEWAARCWFQAGTVLQTLGQEEQAVRCYEQLIKSYPDNPMVPDARKQLGQKK